MARVRRINVSQIEGDNANNSTADEVRPYGDIALYQGDNNKLELLIADGVRTNIKNKVLAKGTFYGGDADSGDNAGLDTIKFIPDAQLYYNNGGYGNDQYLIVDPTAPNHIHIRAGGTIDNSNADLFIGGEKNHVRISDSGDQVNISTDDGSGGTKSWTFNNSGTLTLPAYGVYNGFSKVYSSGLSLEGDSAFESNYAVLNLPTNAASTSSPSALNNYNGNVQINAGIIDPNSTKTWTFDNSGNLTFPNSTVQTTAYAPMSGSWTVTAGTNTYSFEVPPNGTYSMWVRANIPNGIIVWNATATVTNANVPVIGVQYAWNYTGAGSPILLTAIPDQIKGTAGAISTDNSYVGTTSNVFAFSIANTSGLDQTVYWGYIKI